METSEVVANVVQTWNQAFVSFNNQDSVIMNMFVPCYQLLCLLHDNRIYAFKCKQGTEESPSNELNVMLNLLTTPKYRVMSAMYIIFRLLDNINLLLIIILSIINGGFTTPTTAHVALLSAIGLEIFYDLMLYTHKYWILQRLSIYIGIVLYCLYTGIVTWKNIDGDYTQFELQTVIVVLSTRFVFFIFEECVDIAIDGELHNDLLKLQYSRDHNKKVNPEQNGNKSETSSLLSLSSLKSYLDVKNSVSMPQDVDYQGSLFAWGADSVFTKDVWTRDPFPKWIVYLLCIFPFIVTVLLFFLLILLCIAAALLPIGLAYFYAVIRNCSCKPKLLKKKVGLANFWKELTHF